MSKQAVRLTTVEISQDYLEFSAGHFTIFSPTHREKIHGHNYSVYAAITAEIQDDIGMAFDYGVYKKILRAICARLDGYFLLAGQSPHLQISEDGDYYRVHFHNEKMLFLKSDVIILPIVNTTIEELAHWFIQELLRDKATLTAYRVQALTIKVFSSPRQSASHHWQQDLPLAASS